MNKTTFIPSQLPKDFQKKYSVGDVFEKDGKRYQYVGTTEAGDVRVVFMKPSDTSLPHLVGGQIKKARLAKGWNQTQLAEAAELRVATISDIESGKANIQIDTLSKIAVALNCYTDIALVPASEK